MPKTFETLYALVKEILEESEVCRRNDYYLYFYVVKGYGYDPDKLTLTQALKMMMESEIPSHDTLFSIRRKIMREHPKLREHEGIQKRKEEKFRTKLHQAVIHDEPLPGEEYHPKRSQHIEKDEFEKGEIVDVILNSGTWKGEVFMSITGSNRGRVYRVSLFDHPELHEINAYETQMRHRKGDTKQSKETLRSIVKE